MMRDDDSIVFPEVDCSVKVVASDNGEQVSSLKENGRYEYEVKVKAYRLRTDQKVFRRSQIRDGLDRGLIEPGNYVGLLKLELEDAASKEKVAEAYIDVQSSKLEYETEYRSMLEDIADWCMDFLLQLESPVEQYFEAADEVNEATLAQRLYFLKGLLGREEFRQAVQRILAMPNTRWRSEYRTVDIRRGGRLGRHEVRQIGSAGRRMKVPKAHSLYAVVKTVPERIDIHDKRDTVDTPENRFVKYALSLFMQTLEDLLTTFSRTKSGRYPALQQEIEELVEGLEQVLSHDVFKQVAQPDILPLNSPVLQRKEGYRQLLRAWMLFDLAARLSWSGGDDVYAGGKRDAAVLYEYWVFFKMLDLVSAVFELKHKPVNDLLDSKGLVLKLKAGRHLAIDGVYSGAGRKLKVKFSYNRTFGVPDHYPSGGSWSRQMRPDYTLSLWPAGISESVAEAQELMTHVHFDAKYKVDNLVKLFGRDDEDLDEEKAEQRAGSYKRADLLKMHAYRDAIRRSAGAYVLYPGDKEVQYQGFHELLPGLGAFPLRPGMLDDGAVQLRTFLKEIAAHVCNRASQYEQKSYHIHRIHENLPPPAVYVPLPELHLEQRGPSPVEQQVLIGTYRDDNHLRWVLKEGLYNFRGDDRPGSLRMGQQASVATLLLLRKNGEMKADKMFHLNEKGPRIFSKNRLLERGCPFGNKGEGIYIVYSLTQVSKENQLNQYVWDLSRLEGFGTGYQAAWPHVISLSQLMAVAALRD